MNAPAALTQRSSLKDRLEAALNSEASPEALMAEIAGACAASNNAAWEALALIDQYYRRRRLTQEVYRSLKTQTERLALGRSMHADAPATATPASAQASTPTPTPTPTPTAPAAAAPPAPAPLPVAPAAVAPAGVAAAAPVSPASPTATALGAGPVSPAGTTTRRRSAPTQVTLPPPLPARPAPAAAAAPATASAMAPAAAAPTFQGAPRAGQLLRGRYRLEARLDYGGGVVFRALDEFRKELPEDEQRVAIRFPDDAAEAQREFYRAQHLSHPNIARVIEFDRDGDIAFYSMELQHGRLLRDLLKQATHLPLPQPEALTIVRDVAAALQHAHSRQVVHGRLDSSSVMITPSGAVQVLNFGLPRTGRQMEPRDDLSALCLMAYELLAGFRAFEGRSLEEARDRRARLRRPPGLPRRLWRALQRGLAHTAKARAITVEQWARDMVVEGSAERRATPHELIQTQPPRRGSRSLLLVASLAAVALAVAVPGYMYWNSHPNLFAGNPTIPATGQLNTQSNNPPGIQPTSPARTAPPATSPAVVPEQRVERATSPGIASPASNNAPTPLVVSPAETPAPLPPASIPASSAPASAGTAGTPSAAGSDINGQAGSADGPGLLGFQAESFTVAPGEAAARIPVRRTGGARGDVGVVWATEDGNAHAGEDFVSFGQQHEVIISGQKSVTLYIPLSPDVPRDAETNFYVTLSDPSGGAKLGRFTRLKVIIAPQKN